MHQPSGQRLQKINPQIISLMHCNGASANIFDCENFPSYAYSAVQRDTVCLCILAFQLIHKSWGKHLHVVSSGITLTLITWKIFDQCEPKQAACRFHNLSDPPPKEDRGSGKYILISEMLGTYSVRGIPGYTCS